MSEPVTNVEIEDVLSSIRRLVSDGERPSAAPKPLADEPTASDVTDRLVLTPALRIDDPIEEDVVEPPREASSDLETAAADLSFALADGFLEIPPATSEPDVEAESVYSPTEREDLEATIAELEAAVTAQPDEWEPDGSEVEYKPNWNRTLFEAVEEAVGETSVPEIEATLTAALAKSSAASAQQDNAQTADEPPVEAVAFQTEASAQIPEIAEEAVKNNVGDPPHEDARVAFRHLHRDNVVPQEDLVGGAAPIGAEDGTIGDGLTETIDEDALRELVLQIVRQELNGKLGERITRNVRKLVRREIMRVLNAQDLD